jgi:hypothetical protein
VMARGSISAEFAAADLTDEAMFAAASPVLEATA